MAFSLAFALCVAMWFVLADEMWVEGGCVTCGWKTCLLVQDLQRTLSFPLLCWMNSNAPDGGCSISLIQKQSSHPIYNGQVVWARNKGHWLWSGNCLLKWHNLVSNSQLGVDFCLWGNIWQCLEITLVVTIWVGELCYWYAVGRVPRCCWTSYSGQDSPPDKELFSSKYQ